MRIMLFLKLMVFSLCISLLAFALMPGAGIVDGLRMMALGTVASIAITAFYPEVRGIKEGDTVSVVSDAGIPSIIGRLGTASADARRNQQLKIVLGHGSEVVGVVESYTGIISPPRLRIIYEEKLVE